MENEIRMIPIGELYPHPDNPRKDVGDVSELADSIRANGVLQNLTVVPGHRLTDAEWTEMHDRYETEPDETLRERLNKGRSPAGYTVVIGHRRLAAARIAGMTALPCAVAEMDMKTQVATMLLENMQRADLTIPEQAAGMQMMIDLGASVAEISRQTGFAPRTVERRLQIARLPSDALRRSWKAGGCTIEEYVKIAGIRSKKRQEEVLSAVGTNNFSWRLSSALREEKAEENRKLLMAALKIAKIPKYNGKDNFLHIGGEWKVLATYELEKMEPGGEISVPKPDAGTVWEQCNQTVRVLRPTPKTKKEIVRRSEAERSANRIREDLEAVCRRMLESRRAFVAAYVPRRDHEALIWRWLLHFAIVKGTHYHATDDAVLEQGAGDPDAGEAGILAWGWNDAKAPFVTAYWLSGDRSGGAAAILKPYAPGYGETRPAYRQDRMLDDVYRFLEDLGYETSDEERQMLDGTHPLYGEEAG